MAEIQRNEVCWNCNHFKPDDSSSVLTGECRWRPQLVIAAAEDVDPDPPILFERQWPTITDGSVEFCGQWFPRLNIYRLPEPPRP